MTRIPFLTLIGCLVAVVSCAENLNSAICTTEECQKTAQPITENKKETVNPCHDFYGYVCDGSIKDEDNLLHSKPTGDAKNILNKIGKESLKSEDNRQWALEKKWYTSCMNTSRINEMGLKPLVDIIETLGGWPMAMNSTDAWENRNISWEEVNDFYTIFEENIPFRFKVNPLPANSIVFHKSSELWRHIIYNNFSQYEELIAHLVNSYALVAGENPNTENVKSDIKDVYEFASKLFEIPPYNSNSKYLFTQSNFTDFQKQYDEFYRTNFSGSTARKINWQEVFNSTIKRERLEHKYLSQDTIKIQDVPHFLRTSQILMTTPNRTIVNYLIWSIVLNSIEYLDETTKNFYNKVFSSQPMYMRTEPRSYFCHWTLPFKNQGPKIQLAQTYLSGKGYQIISDIMSGIREEMELLIVNSSLINAETKNRLKEKLRTVVWKPISYTYEYTIYDYTKPISNNLEISEDFFQSFIEVRKYQHEVRQNETIELTISGRRPEPCKNAVCLNLDELSAFDLLAPLAVNYGTLGYRLATEIVQKFIGDDILTNVSTENSKFKEFEKFFESFAVAHNVKTETENYKSMKNEFLKQAVTLEVVLKAYHDAVNNTNLQELKLPKFDKLHEDKLFFASFARSKCMSKIENDNGVPRDSYLVNGIVRTMEEFSSAFRCSSEGNVKPKD